MSIIFQRQSRLRHIPDDHQMKQWINQTLAIHKKANKKIKPPEITVRVVNKKESSLLNSKYRHKLNPTNVLSFVYTHNPVCGDIVLCAPLIPDEPTWAHLIIHGTLHLMGYDHVISKAANIMEKQEINILKKLGFSNPYKNEE